MATYESLIDRFARVLRTENGATLERIETMVTEATERIEKETARDIERLETLAADEIRRLSEAVATEMASLGAKSSEDSRQPRGDHPSRGDTPEAQK